MRVPGPLALLMAAVSLVLAQEWAPSNHLLPSSTLLPSARPAFVEGAPCSGIACRKCVTGCHCFGSTPYCLHDTSTATAQCVNGTARPMMQPVFFIHMPKTGGTSFRVSADALIGQAGVCTDYGHGLLPDSSRTVVHRELGDKFLDPAKTACRLLSGHVQVEAYVRDFGLRRTVVFLREPIARIISWYHHVQRVEKYQHSFQDFLAGFRRDVGDGTVIGAGDLMSLRLGAKEIPLAAYGFVGLTERYVESIRTFNDAFALDLHDTRENVDPAPQDLPPGVLEGALRDEFRTDIQLFNQAQALFEERLRMLNACSPYAHGGVDWAFNGTVRGWAWWAQSDEEVVVAIVVGNVLVGHAAAGNRHRLGRWGVPRDGNVGFEFHSESVTTEAEVCCFVRGTGQYLGPGLQHDLPVTNLTHPCNAGIALTQLFA